jgi:hypothetical protein
MSKENAMSISQYIESIKIETKLSGSYRKDEFSVLCNFQWYVVMMIIIIITSCSKT